MVPRSFLSLETRDRVCEEDDDPTCLAPLFVPAATSLLCRFFCFFFLCCFLELMMGGSLLFDPVVVALAAEGEAAE